MTVDVTVGELNDTVLGFTIKQDGEPLDLTNLDVELWLKSSPRAEDDETRKLSSTNSGEIEKTEPTVGQIEVKIPGEWLPYPPMFVFYRLDIVQAGSSPQTGRGTAVTGYITVRDT
jgi:BppU N-terminal domain